MHADKIITSYHSSLFCRTPRCDEMYLTIVDKFFIPGLIHYLRSYIKGCHICQLSRNDKPPTSQLQQRINVNYRQLSRLSMDQNVMPKSHKGHKFILCMVDEVLNYLITILIYNSRSEEIGDVLIGNVISKSCITHYI